MNRDILSRMKRIHVDIEFEGRGKVIFAMRAAKNGLRFRSPNWFRGSFGVWIKNKVRAHVVLPTVSWRKVFEAKVASRVDVVVMSFDVMIPMMKRQKMALAKGASQRQMSVDYLTLENLHLVDGLHVL